MREYELMHERGKPPAVARVSRSIVDDVSETLFGHEEKRVKEVPFSKQDWNQTLDLVAMPVNLSLIELSGTPDVAKAKSAAAKLGPAASALQVMAGHKREPRNQANMLLPLADIQAARTTLEVMADAEHAHGIWTSAFLSAMATIESVIALPVHDEESDEPAPPDAIGARDHELMASALKPTMQRLMDTTAGEPYVDFDPKALTEGQEVLTSLGAFSTARLAPAREAVTRGVQAIKAFAMSIEQQVAEATAHLEGAQQKLSQQAAGYLDAETPPQ